MYTHTQAEKEKLRIVKYVTYICGYMYMNIQICIYNHIYIYAYSMYSYVL